MVLESRLYSLPCLQFPSVAFILGYMLTKRHGHANHSRLPGKTPNIVSPPFMAGATKIRVIKGTTQLMLLPKCTIILASDHPVNKIFQSRSNHLKAAWLYPQATSFCFLNYLEEHTQWWTLLQVEEDWLFMGKLWFYPISFVSKWLSWQTPRNKLLITVPRYISFSMYLPNKPLLCITGPFNWPFEQIA